MIPSMTYIYREGVGKQDCFHPLTLAKVKNILIQGIHTNVMSLLHK